MQYFQLFVTIISTECFAICFSIKGKKLGSLVRVSNCASHISDDANHVTDNAQAMNTLLFILPFALYSAGLASGQLYQLPVVILETPEDAICPPDGDLEAARINITRNLSHILQEIAAEFNQTIEEIDQNDTTTYTVPECGGSGWRRVAFLNMTDPTQQCPDSWREYGQDSVRACGRQESGVASCSSVEYSPDGLEYTHVCGQIMGYQFASPDGLYIPFANDLNGPYVDGVSVTYGTPRQHIWTLYGGVREFHSGCCNTPTSSFQPPSFVEQNYFCDTGNPSDENWMNVFFTTFPLWDNEANCPENANCCAPHSGPWFNTTLMAPTTEDIEIRICGNEPTNNEDTPLELIDIYVM